jgi:hypothetical protein
MIIDIPSFKHYGIVYRYKLSDSHVSKYNSITQGQKLTAKIVHQLFIDGCLTQEVREF